MKKQVIFQIKMKSAENHRRYTDQIVIHIDLYSETYIV